MPCALFRLVVLLRVSAGEVWTARVIGITDGDTAKVLRNDHGQVKIQIAEIDMPERQQH